MLFRSGLTPSDTSGYGFYNVRLREGLRRYLAPDTAVIDTAVFDNDDDNDVAPVVMQDKNKSLFDRIFGGGKKDTTTKISKPIDTAKTKKQLRQERREQRRKEKELENGQ